MNMKVEKLTDEKWLNLFKAKWVDKKGQDRDWLFSSRKDFSDGKIPETINSQREADAVVIVPILWNGNNEENRLIVTKEWRAPLNGYEYGFPAGLIDKGESLNQTVQRELKEETGLDLYYINTLSPVTFSSIGMTDEAIVYAHVLCTGEISNEYLEETEDIETFAWSIDDILDWYFDKCIGSEPNDINWSAKAWPYINNFMNNRKIDF